MNERSGRTTNVVALAVGLLGLTAAGCEKPKLDPSYKSALEATVDASCCQANVAVARARIAPEKRDTKAENAQIKACYAPVGGLGKSDSFLKAALPEQYDDYFEYERALSDADRQQVEDLRERMQGCQQRMAVANH